MLSTVTMSVAYALLANRSNAKELISKASTEYARGLQMINKALRDPVQALEDDTLASVIVLGIFEVITGSGARPGGWCSHAEGANILVKLREKNQTLTELGRTLHVMVRSQMTVHCLITLTSPHLGVDWWMKFGTKDGLPALCARLSLETAELHAETNQVLTSAERIPEDIARVVKLVQVGKALEEKYEQWAKVLPSTWRPRSVAWVDAAYQHNLDTATAYPGRVDEYADISIATACNMMRASRILLAADIVRSSAWLGSGDQDYRITTEYTCASRVSKVMIEDIIASVPSFLGHKINGGSSKTSVVGSAELVGKGALALFIVWPLFVTTMSDFIDPAQRIWAWGRLRYITNELGIGQAGHYSRFDIQIPSMFIMKDKLAEQEGQEFANKQCVEVMKQRINYRLNWQTESVIAGILGCNPIAA
ncbi:hypothetical protein BP5796_09788 [Coleophoma crateriformis]|uniref:Uncharacterized protein n=1 Tax=Coleophoma crateriformis TaxID=565419 RepID=A0A3D8QZ31_9HELO|nr:hypothetical protein BP5796_09788 [Coleophoma crateriformis]